MRMALVTGSSGQVGRAVLAGLRSAGWATRPFDLAEGDDVRDEPAVAAAVEGCDVIVHAAAIAHDSAGSPGDIVATNLMGTWHVLLAAERHRVAHVVYFSSAQVFGFADGVGRPQYRPVDDDHPRRASRPYGMSKRLAEDMCAAWTERTGIATIVLRPVMILDDAGLERITAGDANLGAFVHVDDVAAATLLAVGAELTGHQRMTLCGPGDFDCSPARHLLGWTARHSWPSPCIP